MKAISGFVVVLLLLAPIPVRASSLSYCDTGTWVETFASGANTSITDNSGHTRIVNGLLNGFSNEAGGNTGTRNRTVKSIVAGQSWELDATFTLAADSSNYHAVMDLGVGLDSSSTVVYDLTLSSGNAGVQTWALHGPVGQASSGTWAGSPGIYSVRIRLAGGVLAFKVWAVADPEPVWVSSFSVSSFSGTGFLQISSGANMTGVTPPTSVPVTTDFGSLCLASI